MKWNEQLRQERKSRGWAQGRVAQEIGTTIDTVNRWENGKTFPSSFYQQQLSQLFGKSLEELRLFSLPSEDENSKSQSQSDQLNTEALADSLPLNPPLWEIHIQMKGLSSLRPFRRFSSRSLVTLSTILFTILITVALLLTFNRQLPSTNPALNPQYESIDDVVQGTSFNQFNYVGNGWKHRTNTEDISCGYSSILSNSTISSDDTPNDYVTITFNGVRIEFYGMVAASHGIGAISLDGGSEMMIDFYSNDFKNNQLLWTSPKLSAGTHTFKLRVTGNQNPRSDTDYIAIDRVNITHYVL